MPTYGSGNNKEYLIHIIAVLHLVEQRGTAAEVKEAFAALVAVGKEMSPSLISLKTRPYQLYKIQENGKKLNEELAMAFHHTTYQLLFAANRVRRDIQTAVSYLTTQVQEPDDNNWAKLMQVL